MIQDEIAKLIDLGRGDLLASLLSGRPNTRIDQNPQRLALNFL